jgi:hypothetical protein
VNYSSDAVTTTTSISAKDHIPVPGGDSRTVVPLESDEAALAYLRRHNGSPSSALFSIICDFGVSVSQNARRWQAAWEKKYHARATTERESWRGLYERRENDIFGPKNFDAAAGMGGRGGMDYPDIGVSRDVVKSKEEMEKEQEEESRMAEEEESKKRRVEEEERKRKIEEEERKDDEEEIEVSNTPREKTSLCGWASLGKLTTKLKLKLLTGFPPLPTPLPL